MKLAHILLVCLFVVSAIAGPREEGKRLIEFADRREWLSQEDVDTLIYSSSVHNFMDITDYQDTKLTMVSADPIPTAPAHEAYVKSLLPSASSANIAATITSLSAYHTRQYRSETGVSAAHWLQHQYEGIAAGNEGVTVTNFSYPNFPQGSVIATIAGTGPNKESVVIIGGHLDSVGSSSTGRSPGADDDASGSSTVLEVFRVLVSANYKPDYTLQFMGYAAEEAGLLGSQGIAAEYVKNNADVYAVLQLDMVGYKGNSIGVITDYTSAELNAFVLVLLDTYTSLQYTNSKCGYACSDHASWNKTGYRASFPFETPFGSHNPYIHSREDLLEHLNLDQMEQFAYLGIGFAVELAGVATSN